MSEIQRTRGSRNRQVTRTQSAATTTQTHATFSELAATAIADHVVGASSGQGGRIITAKAAPGSRVISHSRTLHGSRALAREPTEIAEFASLAEASL